ncbi:glycoside hydrolase family 130 protein [Puniceicoccus vermicola]|uniref:Glycosidase n=1 Tax=Puniceicoccus vermicola TaxID=388746 RepID=A0A7X1B233_9BACT|nr:glycoside hydrolase family 130 protein [Puniceicoccus vermicola]MBC2604225.1 glycosidase [Puniceicoccus vermicola]
MNKILLKRHPFKLLPSDKRVILRSFLPGRSELIKAIIERVDMLDDEEVESQLAVVRRDFGKRHYHIDAQLMRHYELVRRHIRNPGALSDPRKFLIGALFSGEYALESAALFNPSMVAHPNQDDAPEGGLRFIMSLRATGEGHISSIEFRAGTIEASGKISLDKVSRYVSPPEVIPDPTYHKPSFILKLGEMGLHHGFVIDALKELPEHFTLGELERNLTAMSRKPHARSHHFDRALEFIKWLADSNYDIQFSDQLAVSERIIFPVSLNEAKGIEDARFVRFTEDDGTVTYNATYTAYNGHNILPQFIRTKDFLHFSILTLNGDGVQNKGMALFPRRINGRYAMLSRQDDENLLIMFSHSPHHWSNPQVILRPEQPWECVKIGNCGSPIETEAGWLVVTHGVGPMREYSIGAVLLDLDDPTRVIGRLSKPLLSAEAGEREGYVPNVVYTCGAMLHGETLILPYAISDRATVIATTPLGPLLAALQAKA